MSTKTVPAIQEPFRTLPPVKDEDYAPEYVYRPQRHLTVLLGSGMRRTRKKQRKDFCPPSQTWATLDPLRIVVMGVTGCGKSTVASKLATMINGRFCDGDSLHSEESVAKMRRGEPLTDEDRWPWFARIATFLNEGSDNAVIACSALKKAYRDYLRREVENVRFLFLDASPEITTLRVSARRGHYMPASLVASQFAALERPDNEDRVTTISADTPVESIVHTFLRELPATRTGS